MTKAEKARKLSAILFFMMLGDYAFTYLGIHVFGFIEEANPIMVWLFEMPLIFSFLARLIHVGVIFLLLDIIYKSGHKHYDKIIYGGILLNIFIFSLHAKWIYLFAIS